MFLKKVRIPCIISDINSEIKKNKYTLPDLLDTIKFIITPLNTLFFLKNSKVNEQIIINEDFI
jgi:hypothetical protein